MIEPEARWTRRDFLTTSAAGASLMVMPGFLAGCQKSLPAAAAGTTSAIRSLPSSTASGYFAQFGIDETVVRGVLAQAMSKGGDYADLFFQHRVQNHVLLEDGQVGRATCNIELGCGVRVLKGDQTGFAFTEDLSPAALGRAAQTAASVADGPAVPIAQAVHRVGTPSYYAIEVPWTEVGVDQKIAQLNRCDQVARAVDPRIITVRATMLDNTGHVLLVTSEGRWVEDFQPMTEARVSCVAEADGRREQNQFSFGVRRGFEFYAGERIDELARTAAERTLVLFDASPPPAGEYPVVLAPGIPGILLHEAIGHGMEADFNRKGISVYADRIGQRIAPPDVTIVDDGTNPHERGSINVDDEGLASQRTVLVENGILRSYMHDRISAAHYKIDATANGRRDCYRFPPVPRMRNTYMLNGPHDPQEVIGSVKKGVWAQTITNGQVNIGSGDFSFYLKNGYLIEDGKLTRPVKDANLIGFGPEVLEKVEMVGNDMELFAGAGFCGKDGQRVPVGFGLPTIRCGGISVGGTL